MSIIDSFSFFIIMITLAVIPSASIGLVVTRSAMFGVTHGVAVAFGIVLGDLVFILLSITGLSLIAESMIILFMAIKFIGGLYLIYLGYTLLITNKISDIAINPENEKTGIMTSFLAGLVLTLGDVKAILFYMSLLPMFIDLSALMMKDISIIVFVTIMTVGGVKISYAFAARRIVSLVSDLRFEQTAQKVAGGFMIGAGSYLIAKG